MSADPDDSLDSIEPDDDLDELIAGEPITLKALLQRAENDTTPVDAKIRKLAAEVSNSVRGLDKLANLPRIDPMPPIDFETYIDRTPQETLAAARDTAAHTEQLVEVVAQLAKAQADANDQAKAEHRWTKAGVWISAVAAVAAIIAIVVTILVAP